MTQTAPMLAHEAAERPIRMVAERSVSFRAWRILSTGHCQPLGEIRADSAEDACWRSLPTLQRGVQFFVEEHDAARGMTTVRLYQVKHKANPSRRFNTATQRMEDVGKEYAALVSQWLSDAFDPRRPFDAFRDRASGGDPQLITAPVRVDEENL